MNIHELIKQAMKDMKVNRAELARRMNISRAAVTQLFRTNLTIGKIVEICEAIGAKIKVEIITSEK
jgi:transcriptional regulator with XRE-family HTH domain